MIITGFPFEENEDWHMVIKMRMLWAKHLYEQGFTKNFICSGSAVYSPYVEAKYMKEYLIALGVPSEHIFTECKAEQSTENLWYSYLYAQKLGFKSIAFASDPVQSKLLKRFIYLRIGKGNIDLLPTVYDTLKVLEMPEPTIDSSRAYVPDFIALPERESFWKRFAGTRGKHINFQDTTYKPACP
ncbi:YdcF family protein [Cyclobacteriaceae bacterium]|nr:YdcF family protein [Cyclobacteriaceae bacterium]